MFSELLKLLLELSDCYNQSPPPESQTGSIHPRIQPILNHLNHSFMTHLDLTHLSEQFYIDKYYLSGLFKESTGFTIMEYVQSKRIQYAKSMIHQGIAITEVASICGFQDYSNFYKTFRKLVKISPSEYRDRVSGKETR